MGFIKNIKILKFEGDGTNYEQKFISTEISENIFDKKLKKKKNQAKLDRTKNFTYLLLHNCRPLLSKIISGDKTGHSAMSPLYFEILLIFPNLLRSKVTVF